MTVDTITALEDEAGENAHRVLDLIQSQRPEDLTAYLNRLDRGELSLVVLALGTALLTQEDANGDLEVRNGILRRQNDTLETANVTLFRDRRALTEKVHELRAYIDAHAAAMPASKRRKASA